MFKQNKELNKWICGMNVNTDIMTRERGWRIFHCYFLKLVEIPKIGESLQKRHYTGFNLSFRFWLPFETNNYQ